MLTDVAGVRVGHWTDPVARTGCTAVVLPPNSVASGEVRGGAPGTREFELLAPGRLVTHVDVVMLSGGSAYGLATCDGAMRWCEENGLGYATVKSGIVPIVVGAIIFDLAVGDSTVRPTADNGYAACVAATDGPIEQGQVGAGTGATIGKIGGPDATRAAGIGTATERDGDLIVSALVVANAAGHLRDPSSAAVPWPEAEATPLENTTIGVIVTNAILDKTECHFVAQSGHHGMARALDPSHTRFDGDALVAVASGEVVADVERVRFLAAHAVEAAIRNAVT